MSSIIIAYLIWKGSYNQALMIERIAHIIAYLIWKGSYNMSASNCVRRKIIAYLIWKGSYNTTVSLPLQLPNYSISDLERKL